MSLRRKRHRWRHSEYQQSIQAEFRFRAAEEFRFRAAEEFRFRAAEDFRFRAAERRFRAAEEFRFRAAERRFRAAVVITHNMYMCACSRVGAVPPRGARQEHLLGERLRALL